MIHTTRWLIIGLFLLTVFYDVLAYSFAGPQATISEVLRNWRDRWPLFGYFLAAFLGGLFAHLCLDD